MKSNYRQIDEIGFTFLECPKCGSQIEEDICPRDDEGRGYCPRCGTYLFTDKPKTEGMEKVLFI